MKAFNNGLLILVFIGSMFIIYSYKILQINDGPHDGVVKTAGKYHIEMKNKEGAFYAYLLDKKMKPINNEMISGTVRFFYSDETSAEFKLKKFEEDGFTTETKVLDFVSCKIVFSVFGKHVWAIFDNQPLVVKDKK